MIRLGCRLPVSTAFAERSFRYSSICSGRLSIQFNVPKKVKDEIVRHRRRVARIAERAHVRIRSAGIARACAAYIPLAVGWVAFNATPLASPVGDGSKIKSRAACPYRGPTGHHSETCASLR